MFQVARLVDNDELDLDCLVTGENEDSSSCNKAKVIALLNESLTLKANAGGKIKAKVREAIGEAATARSLFGKKLINYVRLLCIRK